MKARSVQQGPNSYVVQENGLEGHFRITARGTPEMETLAQRVLQFEACEHITLVMIKNKTPVQRSSP